MTDQLTSVTETAEARISALVTLLPYEAPQIVSIPLGGGKRIFPVYMGNM